MVYSPATTLVKARLVPAIGERPTVQPIEFQFNPSQLNFERSVEVNNNVEGNTRTASLLKKVSFAGPNPIKISIDNIIYDTFETGQSVMEVYINKIVAGLDFNAYDWYARVRRPPLYSFVWGDRQRYLRRCFIESVSYQLTLFLPSGTPVRAKVSLKLQQLEDQSIGAPKQN
ncbi:hypothetical protein BST81_13075 [Leptolyngbya sp. 'hensonii']|uniref:CIS tube protein n=1 Tax=Leptolyngbya sp. 'hensonii' TaxID=1922337 RepID=UPI00094F7AE0|nr:hypothetical protein [Leptolyngbya sp. 'hensonii']OLP17977.1 hypothetical protein BST81_13075 [Leptolyngbya sp. 'hensonii']